MPTLEALPPGFASSRSSSSTAARVLGARPSQRLPSSTLIGELKLTALKARLAAIGIRAEFAGEGVLVCGITPEGDLASSVAVRKAARGHVELEGAVSDVYYKVRKEIYGLHALVAA